MMLYNMHDPSQYLSNHKHLFSRMCKLARVALLFVIELILKSVGWLGFLDLAEAQLGSNAFSCRSVGWPEA